MGVDEDAHGSLLGRVVDLGEGFGLQVLEESGDAHVVGGFLRFLVQTLVCGDGLAGLVDQVQLGLVVVVHTIHYLQVGAVVAGRGACGAPLAVIVGGRGRALGVECLEGCHIPYACEVGLFYLGEVDGGLLAAVAEDELGLAGCASGVGGGRDDDLGTV